jgi:hypothetical protein
MIKKGDELRVIDDENNEHRQRDLLSNSEKTTNTPNRDSALPVFDESLVHSSVFEEDEYNTDIQSREKEAPPPNVQAWCTAICLIILITVPLISFITFGIIFLVQVNYF